MFELLAALFAAVYALINADLGSKRLRVQILLAVAFAGLLAAMFGVFIALVVYSLGSGGDSGTAGVSATNTWQYVVSLVGLIPPLLMVYFCVRGETRRALAALAVGLLVWAGWGVLNDATVHGWGRDNFLVRVFG
jgi:hypothetical protein